MKFEELESTKKFLKKTQEHGFKELTYIQEKCINEIHKGKDVVGQAETGSGKTLAFALPILDKITIGKGIQALILTPTRELSVQVTEVFKDFGKLLGIKGIYGKLNSKKLKSNNSTEEWLREKRYDFFRKVAQKLSAGCVATAHTLDDQAETVLMRIIKGTSLKGIVGIHAVRLDGNIKFIRPFVEVEKKDIMEYLKNRRLPFRIDSTNLEDRFLRNRVRQRVLPYLAKINPRIKRSLFNLAESLKEDFEFIEEERKKRQGLVKKGRSSIYIKLCDILLQPKGLRKEIVREAIRSSGGNIKKLTFRHWKDIDLFLRQKERGKSLDLPGGLMLHKTRDNLIFTK